MEGLRSGTWMSSAEGGGVVKESVGGGGGSNVGDNERVEE